jgi:branched-chain amino acid transport system permease protein
LSLSALEIQTLNALSFGALLFLVASGLSLIFGLMRIINMAHGSFYMLGAYGTLFLIQTLKNQLIASIVAIAGTVVLGAAIQRWLIERVRASMMQQMLVTLGCLLIIGDLSLIAWKGNPAILPIPEFLSGKVTLPGGAGFPVFRLFMVGFGIVLAVVLDQVQARTRIGAMIRAGADDLEMLSCLGINVRVLFIAVFAFGAGLAALGGAMGGMFLGVYPGIDLEVGVYAFIVVLVGGLGSIRGTFVASMLVAFIDNFTKALFPTVSMFAIYLLLVVVITIRPSGLFGRRALA